MTDIRNRIVGDGIANPRELQANPGNWRTHPARQLDALRGILASVGWVQRVIVNKNTGFILDGHARVELAASEGAHEIPVVFVDLEPDEERLVLATLDPIGALAGTDTSQLEALLDSVSTDDPALQALLDELRDGIPEVEIIEGQTEPDNVPSVSADAVSKTGDVWILGDHRVGCGDSTDLAMVERLIGPGTKAGLLHADPPYGMGKEADGVENDNLYREKLDRFQMDWWALWSTFCEDNASAYIWGNAPDLWRLWYCGGLSDAGNIAVRNEIVWDKQSTPGMKSDLMTQYPEASERCLFIQFGEQLLGNVNQDNFFEGWEKNRGYMAAEATACGITGAILKEVCGVAMFSHWFTKSQYTLIPEGHYNTLAETYPGHFTRPWREMKETHDRAQADFRHSVDKRRSYFDNAHDIMRDTWTFKRVMGEERHGHATPKPVDMMERVMKSSLKRGGLVLEPFGGSGSTLMGAERTGRICYTMEMTPNYCDVIVKRWQEYTGKPAILEATGQTFAEVADGLLPEVDE